MSKTYRSTIGLEIHSELSTMSKMFCACENNPEAAKPNLNICPVCMGQPGSLPVINKKAVEMVMKTGLALNCQISEFSKFDRKNYFYPDLPKGYQISQYDLPLCVEGFLELSSIDNHGITSSLKFYPSTNSGNRISTSRNDKIKRICIRRIHLEEDTGKLTHPAGNDYSLVDYNRAGVPLMELVTEPDISSGKEARVFCEELQLILRYLGVSEANMEKGQMRCEVNISVSDSEKLGTKVEIKNLNSFKAVERAIDYEINRQEDAIKAGERIIQETRGWDENKQKTFSQRTKEEAHDYRYFPEPDLPPLKISSGQIEKIKSDLPELPQARRARFKNEYQLTDYDINVLVANKGLVEYFENVASELKNWLKTKPVSEFAPLVKLTANYIITELQKLLALNKKEISDCQISPENFAEFITLISDKTISSSGAQAVLAEMSATGADPSHIIESKDLKQVSDEGALIEIVEQVIKENPDPVKDFKSGKINALQFLVGQAMKASKGKANPQTLDKLFREGLK